MSRNSTNTVKKRIFRIRYLIITAVIIYLAFTFITQQFKINALKYEQSEVEAKIQDLTLEGERISNEIKNLNTPEYIEELARKELGLIKPGEILYKKVIDNHYSTDYNTEQSKEGN
ncbi:MAG TPA: septum formation initiator family protein [Thermoanaerobacterales bacterium]|nr:septum formation initiator family protein [Thermoanaerobacterales bacterium]